MDKKLFVRPGSKLKIIKAKIKFYVSIFLSIVYLYFVASPLRKLKNRENDKIFFMHTVRIYQEDVDSGGIVYHSHYLKYAERARTEWLRQMGLEQSTLKIEEQCHFVVTQADIKYYLPARLDDFLEIRSGPCQRQGIRLIMSQKIFKKERMYVDITVTLVLINNKGKPMRLPSSILKNFLALEK